MRNLQDENDDHDYAPNKLAHLSEEHPKKYRQIVQSNLEPGGIIEKWQQRNLERAQEIIKSWRR